MPRSPSCDRFFQSLLLVFGVKWREKNNRNWIDPGGSSPTPGPKPALLLSKTKQRPLGQTVRRCVFGLDSQVGGLAQLFMWTKSSPCHPLPKHSFARLISMASLGVPFATKETNQYWVRWSSSFRDQLLNCPKSCPGWDRGEFP